MNKIMNKIMKNFTLALAALCFLLGGIALAQDVATLRGAPILETLDPPAMAPVSNKDIRQVRNYPEQPPVIPHKITGYQVDRAANKCLSCHSRTAIEQSQAPMVSITHFMDRDGQFLASVSPRRYFCTQCHVMQLEVGPAVENSFIDIDSILRQEAGASQE